MTPVHPTFIWSLFQVKALADTEDDGLRVGSPKFVNEQRQPAEDHLPRSSVQLPPSTSAQALHQSRSQQKQQQQPQKRQSSQQPQPSQDVSSSTASSVAQNFLPYMYAAGGLPQTYFANLASSMMYSGAFPGKLLLFSVDVLLTKLDFRHVRSKSSWHSGEHAPNPASCHEANYFDHGTPERNVLPIHSGWIDRN